MGYVILGIIAIAIAEILLLPATGLVTGTDVGAVVARLLIPLAIAIAIVMKLLVFRGKGQKGF